MLNGFDGSFVCFYDVPMGTALLDMAVGLHDGLAFFSRARRMEEETAGGESQCTIFTSEHERLELTNSRSIRANPIQSTGFSFTTFHLLSSHPPFLPHF